MSKIYKNQSSLRLILDTDEDISTATTLQIKYSKPSGTSGTLTATISGTTAMYYDFTNTAGVSELNESGLWRFWSKVTFSDGRIGYGEPVNIMVYDEGS